MAKIKYLSRYADTQPPAIRKAKAEARKAYQKLYQANYIRKIPEQLANRKVSLIDRFLDGESIGSIVSSTDSTQSEFEAILRNKIFRKVRVESEKEVPIVKSSIFKR